MRAAHLAALTTLPSCVWRLLLAAGFSMGYQPEWMAANASSAADRVYLVALSLVTEGLALLTLGLVRPWGERLPSWVPAIGGWRVRPLAAVVPASIGAVALVLLWSLNPLLYTDLFHDPLEPQGGWQLLMATAYLPLVLWGPLLGLVTWAYYRRRCTDR
ncbi:hypothetical protein FB561_2828 [Kribbella amoyensis]|uniref:Uncharacterized protein n=1 Tax=Kribbella amoyensis TaxID=996641 RepID=A0A561BS63_9ACTN|nr:hypothetical protein [Kribbella amoyensis]TWD81706.1 hypothetical protein FB561_2828 [Kribbella amoyensis]